MKYNIIGYLIGDGFKNVFKNKKSTASCLIIMCAAMFIFGLFFTVGENVEHMMQEILQSQGLQVFLYNDVSDQEIKKVESELNKIDGVNKITYISREDAFTQVKEEFQSNPNLLDGIEEKKIFPPSFMVTLDKLELNEQIQSQIRQIDKVEDITTENDTITTLMGLAKGIRIVSLIILIILVVISIFIISNTIKLTVYARRKEISIMKYVGATNGFIRWPFIVEGIIIGLIAAMLSIVIVGVAYNVIINKLMLNEIVIKLQLSFVSFADMVSLVIGVYLILGIGIGIIGSMNSMRKYLKV